METRLRRISTVQLDCELQESSHPSGGPLGRALTARVLDLPPGQFDALAIADPPDAWLGLLVLDGFVAVGLEAGRAHACWLVGAEDLIRPWNRDRPAVIDNLSWRALTDTRVALLDDGFARRTAGIPPVTRELVGRAAQTTHWLLAKSLIAASTTVDERLRLLFALLSERWGRVRPDGVRLDLPLTHELLARMCGVRRPSVTTCLRSLRERGVVERIRRGSWLVHGDLLARPPHAPTGLEAMPSSSGAGWSGAIRRDSPGTLTSIAG